MLAQHVPAVLRERLGNEATAALVELFGRAIEERKPEMITTATERFERRLVEEISAVRVLIAQNDAALRGTISQTETRLVERMSAIELRGSEALQQVRGEMADMGGALRQEIAASEGRIRQELAAGRVELLKWSFTFWIGQVLALLGFMAVIVRMVRP